MHQCVDGPPCFVHHVARGGIRIIMSRNREWVTFCIWSLLDFDVMCVGITQSIRVCCMRCYFGWLWWALMGCVAHRSDENHALPATQYLKNKDIHGWSTFLFWDRRLGSKSSWSICMGSLSCSSGLMVRIGPFHFSIFNDLCIVRWYTLMRWERVNTSKLYFCG
jgi:hypothetical protein